MEVKLFAVSPANGRLVPARIVGNKELVEDRWGDERKKWIDKYVEAACGQLSREAPLVVCYMPDREEPIREFFFEYPAQQSLGKEIKHGEVERFLERLRGAGYRKVSVRPPFDKREIQNYAAAREEAIRVFETPADHAGR